MSNQTVIVEFNRPTTDGYKVSRKEFNKSMVDKIFAKKSRPGNWKYAKIVQKTEEIDLGLKTDDSESKKPGPKKKDKVEKSEPTE